VSGSIKKEDKKIQKKKKRRKDMIRVKKKKKKEERKSLNSWVLVAQVCNPSYLGSRDQED
jgi:hypothetical protein